MNEPMTWASVAAIIAMIGSILSIALGIKNGRRTDRKDTAEDAQGLQEVRGDLKYIARGVDDIRVEQRAMREQMGDISERLTRVEESSKQAHKRLDRIDAPRGTTG